MALPDIIEILPLSGPVRAVVSVPGSKSITNRALVLAALADGETVLNGALWSEDTQVMVDSLQTLGFSVQIETDPLEDGNRTIRVRGEGGSIPRAGSPAQPLELFVGNAGTAARFLSAMVCLGKGAYRLSGAPRMQERPQQALFQALRQLGYQVDAPKDKMPAVIHGTGPRPGQCLVSIQESSQFASALMLSAERGGWKVELEGEGSDDDESPYVAMTQELIKAFPQRKENFQIEPDASSGSYFWAVNLVNPVGPGEVMGAPKVSVAHWPVSGWQVDAKFPSFLPLPPRLSRQEHLGDSIMTAIALAPLAAHPVRFEHLGRLRLQECERVHALKTELIRCGATVIEEGDTLIIHPSTLHGAEIETYDDHRMAMSFAILGLKVPGIRLKNPACVRKTFPNFFQKLAAPSPVGLGVTVLDATAGGRVPLEGTDLFAY